MINNYIVYTHISPNNKRYIGLTSQSPNRRWRNGKAYKENKHFSNSINKYGWDNFQHIIIAKGLTEEEAKWLEIELIREWNTTDPKFGYNCTNGGEGRSGYKPSEEWKRYMSEVMTGKLVGEKNPMYGKHHTLESKQKMSNSRKGKQYALGMHHTEETKKKLSKKMSGKNNPMYGKGYLTSGENNGMYNVHRYGKDNPNAKKIKCLETNQVFDTQKEAYESVNGTNAGIWNAIKNNKKYKGYTFVFYESD